MTGNGMWAYRPTGKSCSELRVLIDSVMASQEANELEDAWKWFRGSVASLSFNGNGWAVGDWVKPMVTRDAAVLAAYWASKGKE